MKSRFQLAVVGERQRNYTVNASEQHFRSGELCQSSSPDAELPPGYACENARRGLGAGRAAERRRHADDALSAGAPT